MIFPSALVRLEAADNKSEPSLQPLAIVRAVDLICHLWQQYVNVALLPLAAASVTIRREMVVYNGQTVNRMETASNTLLQRITDGTFPLYCLVFVSNSLTESSLFSDHKLAVNPTH